MSEGKVDAEIVRKQCTKDTRDTSFIDEVELIDVSLFDSDDTNSWLCVPTGCQTESTVYNFYSWLKSEPELPLTANRRSIDTRTFTRPKKRTTRTSFESVLDALPLHLTSTRRTSCLNFSNAEEDLIKFPSRSTSGKEEAVPSILRMASTSNIGVLPDESVAASGEDSMELFLNMADSKGIDSFINLMEPGIHDSLMKVSQPSILYSSIISLSRDESSHNTDCDKEEESASLNHTYDQNNVTQRENLKDLNETFSMGDSDNNKGYCLDLINKPFRNESYTIGKTELNETYNAELISQAPTGLGNDTYDKISLSSTFVNKDDGNVKLPQSSNNGKKELYHLDTTYLSCSSKAKNPPVLNATFYGAANKNATCTIETNACEDKNRTRDLRKDSVFSVSENPVKKESETNNDSFTFNNALDSAFAIPLCNQSTPKTADVLNSTFRATNKYLDQPRIHNAALSSNFKAPTSLRKELLAEIHRSGDRRLDCTFDHSGDDLRDGKAEEEVVSEVHVQNVKNDVPIENKYNTYRKEPSVNRVESQAETVSELRVQNSPERKYYTFTRKVVAHGGKTDMENTEPVENNVEATFVKPLPKLPKRKNIPRMLSKLPQFLQKSNPNLTSNSLKTVSTAECANAPGVRYKGSQPNIVRDVEKSLANKLYPLGKVKSGSEQRLIELNAGVGELQMMGAGGSTESIESTQSAHSAPDLDDRLSTCSDSSHNSYTVQPMNIEQYHRIVQMQEESLKQDVVHPVNKRVVENDKDKNLASPILKNGIDSCKRNSSPLTMDYTVKTSSPILSPNSSSQSTNADGHAVENQLKQENELDTEEKGEVFNKTVTKIENRTRLRQPTNWNTGNRASSAIPRPASRIPAPRFARPTAKSAQGEVRK